MMSHRYTYEYKASVARRGGGGSHFRTADKRGAFIILMNEINWLAIDCHGFREVGKTLREKIASCSVELVKVDHCTGYPPQETSISKIEVFKPWRDPEMDRGFFLFGKQRLIEWMKDAGPMDEADLIEGPEGLANWDDPIDFRYLFSNFDEKKSIFSRAFAKWWLSEGDDDEDFKSIKKLKDHWRREEEDE